MNLHYVWCTEEETIQTAHQMIKANSTNMGKGHSTVMSNVSRANLTLTLQGIHNHYHYPKTPVINVDLHWKSSVNNRSFEFSLLEWCHDSVTDSGFINQNLFLNSYENNGIDFHVKTQYNNLFICHYFLCNAIFPPTRHLFFVWFLHWIHPLEVTFSSQYSSYRFYSPYTALVKEIHNCILFSPAPDILFPLLCHYV